MKRKLSAWENAYRKVGSLWGLEPDHLLREYASIIPKGKVLDLGIGEGRNALFLAEMGYTVEGIDLSETAIKRCLNRARSANLRVKARVGELIEEDILRGKYALIVAAWVLNFFKKSEAGEIILKMKSGLREKGLVYVGAFSINDPGYEHAKARLELVDENTFYSRKLDSHYHYFTKEEMLSLFADLETIYYGEGTSLDLSHGEPHYHGFIEYMGQRRQSS